MALTLPYPDMNFVPLDVLTAAEQNQLVANIEYIAGNVEQSSGLYVGVRKPLYIDGTNGDDTNDGLTTSTPKKTLAGIMSKINEIGGSADIRFMSAGTYNWDGGYLDSANFLLEKNASGIGDVVVNFTTKNMNADNCVIEFKTINVIGSYTFIPVNSYVAFSSNSVIDCNIQMNCSVLMIDTSVVKNKVAVNKASTGYYSNITVEPSSSVISGSLMSANQCSNIHIQGAVTVKSPTGTSPSVNLFAIGDGCDYVMLTNASIVDNTGTQKYTRGLVCSRSIVQCSNAQLTDLQGIANNVNSYSGGTLRIVGNAVVGE